MTSLTLDDLRICQQEQIEFAAGRNRWAVFSEMGLGKCGATLTVVSQRIKAFLAHRVLIIAPLSVARKTWPDEIAKWAQANWLRYSFLRDEGDDIDVEGFKDVWRVRYWIKKINALEEEFCWAKKGSRAYSKAKKELKIARQALKYGLRALDNPADIHLINWQNVHWLVHFWGKFWPYDTIVYDESSIGLRSGREALVWRAMRKLMPHMETLIQLNGSPMPKGLEDLWGQIYLLDGGERLGRTLTDYRTQYFDSDYMGYKYTPKPGAMEQVLEKIADIVIVQRSRDYMDLPPEIPLAIPVVLSKKDRNAYKELEREYILDLDDGGEIIADTAAILTNKLLQLANGRIYDKEHVVHEIHQAKLDAMEEYLDARLGENVLCAYWYDHDLQALKKRFPHAKVLTKKNPELQDEWNAGEVELMFMHPQSDAHGINIQFGGRRVLWFGPIWRRDLYEQLNMRLGGARSVGQGSTFLDHLIVQGTADEYVMEVLKSRGDMQEAALYYLNRLKATFS